MALALVLVFGGGAAVAQIGPGPFAAFPSLDPTDARFMSFGCAGIATFEAPVTLTMAIPADQTTFTISFFDGDTGGTDGAGKAHWDVGSRQLVYNLYADPLRQGVVAPANLIGSWKGNDPNPLVDPDSGHPTPLWTASAAQMPDNAWWGAAITTSVQAQAPSGNYFYLLQIGLDGACASGEQTVANIKIAASNPMSFLVPRFGLEAALRQVFNDGPIVYPGPTFPPPGNDFVHAPTTYDGTFNFFFRLPGGETDLRLYDGDFDHGSVALVGLPSGTVLSPCADTDDPDTPFNYAGFPFSTTGANPEGVNTPGSPQDDSALDIFRRGEPGDPGRVGCVRYEVHDPNGTVYRNDNPSGSFEWEQFRIATPNAVDPSNSDYVAGTSTLPAGIWSVNIVGLDLSNLNFFYANACATRNNGSGPEAACPDLSPYLLGDTVWLDKNGNGVQDAGEPGIPGVIVNLVKASDLTTVASVVTGDTQQPNWTACVLHNTGLDTQGLFCLGADRPGDYLLQVAAENFQPGGALAGFASTTGGESQTHTVVDNNVLTYDFGYRVPPDPCVNGPLGGIDLGALPKYLFLFANGNQDANWQGATKGFVGNVAVDGVLASERTSGRVPYAGTIFTNDSSLGAWQTIVSQNGGQASASTGNTALISSLKASLTTAFAQINSLPATPGYESVSSTSLNGLNTTDGMAKTYVINVTSGFQVSSQINVTGDPGDVFVLRWDADHTFNNGYQGTVKFQSGGAIVPHGGLTPASFIHVAGDIDASGGGNNPPAPYPQGPRFNDGTGALISGASNFSGGGFFTGYWLTTGDPSTGQTHSLSNAIFVGGWYTLSNKLSLTSGTSGVEVCPHN